MATEEKEKLYEYYGIPYGIFDNVKKNADEKVEEDRTEAQLLIM